MPALAGVPAVWITQRKAEEEGSPSTWSQRFRWCRFEQPGRRCGRTGQTHAWVLTIPGPGSRDHTNRRCRHLIDPVPVQGVAGSAPISVFRHHPDPAMTPPDRAKDSGGKSYRAIDGNLVRCGGQVGDRRASTVLQAAQLSVRPMGGVRTTEAPGPASTTRSPSTVAGVVPVLSVVIQELRRAVMAVMRSDFRSA